MHGGDGSYSVLAALLYVHKKEPSNAVRHAVWARAGQRASGMHRPSPLEPPGWPDREFSKGREAGFSSLSQLQESITFGQTVSCYELLYERLALEDCGAAQEWSWHTLTGYKFKYFSKRQIFFVLCYENL